MYPMEKLTLKPVSNEIIVNSGATEGAVDLFCYHPDDDATRNLGALYVVGHRLDESSNMGYMVSLIAALARREYYGQATVAPREAFARTLRKANEVVEELFRSGDAKLSVGIVAVAGGQIMVSKLDKFKIFLARDGQVIDILSNVMLFSKEHAERLKFSSIIHGSIQAGDRILAFVPTRGVTTRERSLKTWFQSLPQHEFAQRVSQIGQEHATFATAMLHINIAQVSEPALMPSPQPAELTTVQSKHPTPSLAARPAFKEPLASPIAWTPRQQSAPATSSVATPESTPDTTQYEMPSSEIPHIISSEFSLGTRRTSLSRFFSRIRFMRLDGRGKAVLLAVAVTLITGGVLLAKTVFIASPQEQRARQAIFDIQKTVDEATEKSKEGNTAEARTIFTRALSSLQALGSNASQARDLSASILSSLDSIDNAQSVEPTLLAFTAPDTDAIRLATWSSNSQSYYVSGIDTKGEIWVATLADSVQSNRTILTLSTADLLVAWRSSTLTVNTATRTITRRLGDTVHSYIIPVQETILDAAEFSDNLYVLTDKTILKITDLDTEKPVTKRWLETDDQFAEDSARILVDGSVYTMTHSGMLTTYYKGKKSAQVQAPVSSSGVWRLLPGPDGSLAVAVGDARRVYLIDATDGALIRTLKVDSQIPFIHVAPGQNGSILLLTSEGKLWLVQ